MKLLYTKRSPYARKVRVLAIEKNIPLDLIDEDLMNKSKVLLAANPLGKIPTLILDDGSALCDSPVICEYLESIKPQPVLIPSAGMERFKVLHLAAIADGVMDNSVALYMEKVRHPNDMNAAYVANLEKAMNDAFKYFDDHISDLSLFNLASVAAASAIGYSNFRLPHLNPNQKFTRLAAWYEQILTRPSMKETIPTA